MISLYILLVLLGFIFFLLLLLFMPICFTASSGRRYVHLSIPPLAEGHIDWFREEPRIRAWEWLLRRWRRGPRTCGAHWQRGTEGIEVHGVNQISVLLYTLCASLLI